MVSKILVIIIGIQLLSCEKKQELGTKDKLIIEKYENDEIKSVGYVRNGLKTGEWHSYVRARLSSIICYKEGKQNGKEVWFDLCTGRIIELGFNDMGNPVGLWYRYLDGELISITEYKYNKSKLVYLNSKFTETQDGIPPPPSEFNIECEEFNDF